MGLFHKHQEIDQKVQEYQKQFVDYINGLNDDCKLNQIFTEITILRIKLDSNDYLLQNLKDEKKRRKNCERKKLILIQFEDLMNVCKKYKSEQYLEIDEVMKRILPPGNVKNCWDSFVDWIKTGIDNATGKKWWKYLKKFYFAYWLE